MKSWNKVALSISMAMALALPLTHAADADAVDPHAHHQHMLMAPQNLKRSNVQVELPKLKVVRVDDKPVMFADEIDDGRPVILNFIYTTCTAICPISSSTFMQLQKKLGKDSSKVHLVSISIDPEQDTPAQLRKYAKKYHAGPGWDHYTGTTEASLAIQGAFNVYRGDKMSHDPVTFVRLAPGKSWLRIDGFATADGLLQDYQSLLAAK